MAYPENAQPDAPPTDLDRLKVALAVQVARRIVDADGILDVSEIELLGRAFPEDWLRRCGFVDASGQLNSALDSAYEQAERELSSRLDLHQKLELITLFHETCLADGELHETELEVLTDVARKLHIPRDRFRRHISRLRQGTQSVPPVQPE